MAAASTAHVSASATIPATQRILRHEKPTRYAGSPTTGPTSSGSAFPKSCTAWRVFVNASTTMPITSKTTINRIAWRYEPVAPTTTPKISGPIQEVPALGDLVEAEE